MYRVVYCPDASMMDEAVAVAKEWSLPVQTGDSERTRQMSFDRSSIKVLMVPTDRGFDEIPERIAPRQFVKITYSNDFVDCKTLRVKLHLKDDESRSWDVGSEVLQAAGGLPDIRTFQLDAHRILIPLIVSSAGVYKLTVNDDNGVVDFEYLNVGDPE